MESETTLPYLIVGLGNPGREYLENRHNVGFMAVDALAKKLGAEFKRVQHNALVTQAEHQGRKLILAKPRTYMNLSGQAVGALLRFYKLPLEQMLVVYDDADLPLETIRMRPEGGSAGQKGVRSIIEQLGTETFPRLRIGIGRPPGKMKTPSYVLQNFSGDEKEALPFVLARATDAMLTFVTEGIDAAMNGYNRIEP